MATATENNVLEAQPRTAGTKNDARRVRRERQSSGCLYGAGKDAVPVSLDPRQVSRILHSQTGHNTIFDLALDGGERTKAMIVDWQYEPIKGALLHIDLKRIAMDKTLTVNVPIVLKGEAGGREAAGRHSGADSARSGDRVLAQRHSGVHRSGCQRIGVRKGAARVRSAAQRQTQVPDRSEPAGGHVISVKEEVVATPEAVAAEAGATPAEPEVIKKGKQEVGRGRRGACRREGGEAGEEREEVGHFTTESQRHRERLVIANAKNGPRFSL